MEKALNTITNLCYVSRCPRIQLLLIWNDTRAARAQAVRLNSGSGMGSGVGETGPRSGRDTRGRDVVRREQGSCNGEERAERYVPALELACRPHCRVSFRHFLATPNDWVERPLRARL